MDNLIRQIREAINNIEYADIVIRGPIGPAPNAIIHSLILFLNAKGHMVPKSRVGVKPFEIRDVIESHDPYDEITIRGTLAIEWDDMLRSDLDWMRLGKTFYVQYQPGGEAPALRLKKFVMTVI